MVEREERAVNGGKKRSRQTGKHKHIISTYREEGGLWKEYKRKRKKMMKVHEAKERTDERWGRNYPKLLGKIWNSSESKCLGWF